LFVLPTITQLMLENAAGGLLVGPFNQLLGERANSSTQK
jgi:hypothetical protein